ncbi:dihydrofolate reductase family protein [Candidatus Saccharibacteria bacterium]|nr:dihydrofolate reductase family protein [Candidatus Saccharibacteria bacterium]
MKVVMLAAVSADGFIATNEGNSNWAKDGELFEATSKNFGCLALGHTTYKQYKSTIYPIQGVQHLVLSHEMSGDSGYKNVHFVGGPAEAVKKAKELGFKKLLVAGGGQCNGAFVAAKLIDAIWLDEHTVRLGKGIKLFGDYHIKLKDLKPQKTRSTKYKDFVHVQYKPHKIEKTMRLAKDEARYRARLKAGNVHRLEELPALKEFKYFKIVDNEYPHTRIAVRHHMLVPKRVVDHWTKLNQQEWREFQQIDKYLSKKYDCIKLNYPSYITMSYIVHWHLYNLR